jgi:disulfide bond formation protein DsbB
MFDHLKHFEVKLNTKTVTILERILNCLELTAIIFILSLAFIFQIVFQEIPCPLCLLQRIGFIGIVFGLLLNLRFGFRPLHYGIVILSAILTSAAALRQIALHIVPGTGAYGNALLGLHLYTWSFLGSIIIIIMTVIMFSAERQYKSAKAVSLGWQRVMHILFALTFLIVLFNVMSVFMVCGWHACPDNPTQYSFFHKLIG